MHRFEKSYIEMLSDADKQFLLLSSIPMLSGVKSRVGNEGTVFFVSKDIIVKKYFSEIDNPELLNHVFNKYCEECDQFYLKGYNIPKIYTWTMISRPDHSGFDYYLLEERVPGRELFLSNILRMYDEFKDIISGDDFIKLLEHPEDNMRFYEKVVKEYIHDFIDMNAKIESMSDVELDRFLEGVYKMLVECNYAIPDVHARNVLFHQGKLNLIDLYLEQDKEGRDAMKMTPPECLLLARMIALFNYNGDIKKFKNNDVFLRHLNEDIDFNELLCTEAMKKIIRSGKRLCKFSPNKEWWESFVPRIEKILEKDNVESVIKEMDISF